MARWRFGGGACLAVLALGVVTAAGADAPPGIDKGVRLFMTGHSFHMPMQAMLTEVAKSAGLAEHALVGTQGLGGSRVIQIWNIADEKNAAKRALAAGNVDVFTTSPHRLLPDEGLDKFVDLAVAHNPKVRVLAQLSWSAYDSDLPKDPGPAKWSLGDRDSMTAEKMLAIGAAYIKEVGEQVEAVNKRVGRTVVYRVPTGLAVIALRERVRLGQAPGIAKQSQLYVDRIGHVTPPINLLNAYCHFAVIYRRTPVGLPVPPALKGFKEEERGPLNRLLQEIAWEAVTGDALSGVKR
jgi:hypothetical protein